MRLIFVRGTCIQKTVYDVDSDHRYLEPKILLHEFYELRQAVLEGLQHLVVERDDDRAHRRAATPKCLRNVEYELEKARLSHVRTSFVS